MPYRKWIGLLLLFIALSKADISVADGAKGQLSIAWVENGDLIAWAEGDSTPQQLATGDVERPFIAPDSEHIAYTRTTVVRGLGVLATTLWVIERDSELEQQIIPSEQLPSSENQILLIGEVVWGNNTTLYFDTLSLNQTTFEVQSPKNLWEADIRTGEVTLITPIESPGSYSISPNHQYAVIVYPGLYGDVNGLIRLIDLTTLESHDLLSFASVSSGSESPFFPEVFWEADSGALRVAIPDKDLVYDDVESAPTALWRLPLNGQAEQIGDAPASFFGQPRWSSDGSKMGYLQRVGGTTSNRFDLMLADGDGQNAVIYVSSEGGQFGLPYLYWIHETSQFLYTQGSGFWLGEANAAPRRFPVSAISLQFVDSQTYVYFAPLENALELRYARLDEAGSTLIATVQSVPFYQALMINP